MREAIIRSQRAARRTPLLPFLLELESVRIGRFPTSLGLLRKTLISKTTLLARGPE